MCMTPTQLRQDLIARATNLAKKNPNNAYRSHGGTILFKYPMKDNKTCHGNFLEKSYQEILTNNDWKARLLKAHTGKRHFDEGDRENAKELDSCCSSDALLMNIFCHPSTLKNMHLAKLLGLKPGTDLKPDFGWHPGLKRKDGTRDNRTEIDMHIGASIGGVVCEAKLTEQDFTCKNKAIVDRYDGFKNVFNHETLAKDQNYRHYQLIRNILVAHQFDACFRLLCDARRTDLINAFTAVIKAITPTHINLKERCKIITWQKIAATTPPPLQIFLKEKYGIIASTEK